MSCPPQEFRLGNFWSCDHTCFSHQPSMQIIEENCCFSNWNIVTEFRMGIILHSPFKYMITCVAL